MSTLFDLKTADVVAAKKWSQILPRKSFKVGGYVWKLFWGPGLKKKKKKTEVRSLRQMSHPENSSKFIQIP